MLKMILTRVMFLTLLLTTVSAGPLYINADHHILWRLLQDLGSPQNNIVATGPPNTVATGPPNTVATGLPNTVATGPPNIVATGPPMFASYGNHDRTIRIVAAVPPSSVATTPMIVSTYVDPVLSTVITNYELDLSITVPPPLPAAEFSTGVIVEYPRRRSILPPLGQSQGSFVPFGSSSSSIGNFVPIYSVNNRSTHNSVECFGFNFLPSDISRGRSVVFTYTSPRCSQLRSTSEQPVLDTFSIMDWSSFSLDNNPRLSLQCPEQPTDSSRSSSQYYT